MTVLTTFRLCSNTGLFLTEISQYSTADYVLNCVPGGIGVMELTLPLSIPVNLFQKHGRLSPYRSIDGGPPRHDNNATYVITLVRVSSQHIFVRAYHMNMVFNTRYVLYDAGTTFTSKTGAADDLIKAFWNENAGSSISAADRDGVETQADLSSFISTQGNLTAGPSLQVSATREHLGTLLKRIADASATAGTYLTYEIVALSDTSFEIRTYTSQRGLDRRAGTASEFILSELRANLENASFTYDWTNEITFASAGGSGQGSDRLIQTSIDTARINESPISRAESFFDHSNASNTTILQMDADGLVREGRPTILAEGELVESPKSVRGVDYDLGDILTVENPYNGDQIDVRLEVIHEHYDGSASPTAQPLSAHEKSVRRTVGGLRSL